MSYARRGEDSDVYVYSSGTQLHCCFCRLAIGDMDTVTENPGQMLLHLRRHQRHGHQVPVYALNRLRNEAMAQRKRPRS